MEIVVASTVEYYRRVARKRVAGLDVVVEVGCATGKTTRILAGRCARVIAVDIAEDLVERARRDLADCANVLVARVDGRDMDTLASLAGRPDALFVDIGGNAPMENVATVAWLCLRYLRPKHLMVVRSECLADFTVFVTDTEKVPFRENRCSAPRPAPLESLLELSRSPHAGNRIFAARRLRAAVDSPEACKRLQEMTSDPHSKVRRIVQSSIRAGS